VRTPENPANPGPSLEYRVLALKSEIEKAVCVSRNHKLRERSEPKMFLEAEAKTRPKVGQVVPRETGTQDVIEDHQRRRARRSPSGVLGDHLQMTDVQAKVFDRGPRHLG